ncbi:Metallo-dependent hydrolase [Corynespora cassiicola Philippines]|uniref:Metallo-dependent hydrolase n=1 Tax=Corynespora cassiicola Philippines TaxID=1448308 RepID=A0A2T2PCK0_CORCC|nr:Metallo-dependent hydrolase [Corynespora cassiicola Philippines]
MSQRIILLISLLALSSLSYSESILFEHGAIISFDEVSGTLQILRDHSLLVVDDTINAIFPTNSTDVPQNFTIPAGTIRISAEGDIISPGYVDTHRHVWQTVHRSLGGVATLADYLTRLTNVTIAARAYDPEISYYSELVGLCEAVNAGVTTIVDHASGSFTRDVVDAYIQATKDSGIRSVFAYNIGGYDTFPFSEQIEHFRTLMVDGTLNGSTISLGIAYERWAFGIEPEIQAISELITDFDVAVLETHAVGGVFATENNPTLLAQIQLANGTNLLNTTMPVIFVHGTSLTPMDITLLRTYNHYMSYAPEFEMSHSRDVGQQHLAQDQASLSVGTHYTNSGDMVTQARIWLQNVRERLLSYMLTEQRIIPSRNPMSTNQGFLLATRSGAQALRRNDLGVLRVGAKADIVVYDGKAPGMLGWSDPVTAVLLHSHIGHVKHVLVNGKVWKRDGQIVHQGCLSTNETNIEERFVSAASSVQQFWKENPASLEGVFLTGYSYGSTQDMDVVRGSSTGY